MTDDSDLPLREWLSAAPFTLTMSSGFFGFFAHAGVLSVLEEENLLPARVSGSSAGALIGSLWASGRTMPELTQYLFDLRKSDFWDPGPGAGLLKGKLFRTILTEISGVDDLGDCRVPVSVSAWNGFSLRTRTFSTGPFADCVYAACAVPFMFQPAWIERQPYWDGGISDRPGLLGVPANARVFYHHLQSRRKAGVSRWSRRRRTMPTRPGMRTLTIDDLPAVSPNKLQSGPLAFEKARLEMRAALQQ